MAAATSSAFNAESKLVLLPQDMLSHVCALSSRNDLLAFRGTSSACRDAVRRAVDGHDIASCRKFHERVIVSFDKVSKRIKKDTAESRRRSKRSRACLAADVAS